MPLQHCRDNFEWQWCFTKLIAWLIFPENINKNKYENEKLTKVCVFKTGVTPRKKNKICFVSTCGEGLLSSAIYDDGPVYIFLLNWVT